MKRYFLFICKMSILLIMLSGCAGSSNKNTDMETEISERHYEDVEDDKNDESENDTNNYLLSVGMYCADEAIQSLKNNNDGALTQQMNQIIQAYDKSEAVNAVLIPFQYDDLDTVLDLKSRKDFEFYMYMKDYMLPYRSMYWLYRSFDDVLTNEDRNDYVSFLSSAYRFAVSMPNEEGQEWLLPIFYGDIDSPDAGMLVSFQYYGNDIIYVIAYGFGKNMAQNLLQECQEWLNKGVWYTESELLDAKKDFDKGQMDISTSRVANINEFLIEKAVSINDRFYQDLISNNITEFVNHSDEISIAEIEHIADSIKKFDVGIVMPNNLSSYPNSYSESVLDVILNLREDVLATYPLPEAWVNDVYVILGNQDADCYAMLSFRELDNHALMADYMVVPLGENEKFMDIREILDRFQDDYVGETVVYESPYGTWSEYAGIQNIDNMEPANDPSDLYDYLLCSGGGYSIVAKQIESVTDVIEYIGVLDEYNNWVVPLSDNTYMNPGGKVSGKWTGYSSYDERCTSISYHINYAGGDAFVYGQSAVGDGSIYESGFIGVNPNGSTKIFHVSTNTWVNIDPDYKSCQSIWFTNGYYVAANIDNYSQWGHGKYILIVNSETGAQETSIYCEGYKYVGQYSEGVFFSYDGFYDIDENRVIDLSDYAGLIINQPYFLNGECELIAENPNGTKYKAVIDTNGNFMSEFEKIE